MEKMPKGGWNLLQQMDGEGLRERVFFLAAGLPCSTAGMTYSEDLFKVSRQVFAWRNDCS